MREMTYSCALLREIPIFLNAWIRENESLRDWVPLVGFHISYKRECYDIETLQNVFTLDHQQQEEPEQEKYWNSNFPFSLQNSPDPKPTEPTKDELALLSNNSFKHQ